MTQSKRSAKMPTESENIDNEKSIADRLRIKKTDQTALKDFTSNDGNEDPGSGLDTEFRHTNKDNKNTLNDSKNTMTEKKVDNVFTSQQISGTPPKGEELDAFTNNASKKQKAK
jgi:hypothetical protein